DNYRVETRIVVWHAEAVLQVPNSALFRRRGQWAVFVVNGRTADTRPVVIGHIGSSHAEVLAGLQENDLVVLHPSDTLADGSTVAYEAEL
ncbi:MAG TPA: hypothetical protein VEB21_19670, partial [Terriglobales bacterium]|nr:hypothetical protein [Terriglobales bacterium]